MDITHLLNTAVEKKASDLHIAVGDKPVLRIDGTLVRLDEVAVTESDARAMLKVMMTPPQLTAFDQELESDFSYALSTTARFRVNVFHQSSGISAVFRTIPMLVPSMEELALPAIVKDLCQLPNGLVLVTGPTGSGKSTTLAAMIEHINQHTSQHIITIEDPIEFTYQSKQCLINQREVGRDTLAFSSALRAVLREDPDIILVGEMRDLETIRLALTAAETGHLVFATLHTNSAAKTIDRLVDVFPAGEKDMIRAMLSESLRAVVAQTLLKRVGGGRVAAHEIMMCTPAVRNLIRENKVPQIISAIQTGKSIGMCTMEQSLALLKADGVIDDDA